MQLFGGITNSLTHLLQCSFFLLADTKREYSLSLLVGELFLSPLWKLIKLAIRGVKPEIGGIGIGELFIVFAVNAVDPAPEVAMKSRLAAVFCWLKKVSFGSLMSTGER